jgi:hypothetical protein
MIRARHLLIAVAMLTGLQATGQACATLREEIRIDSADAVIDGLAVCDLKWGKCRLRARQIVKEDSGHRTLPGTYALRFRPGANDHGRKVMRAADEIWMCFWPWEPNSARIEGRFFLTRAGNVYRIREDSARGGAPIQEVAE